jgi:GMP synthase (glutamine-hydrolysing)
MESSLHQEKILILDFGSQYTQLIARRVRECKVYSEIHPFNTSLDKIKRFNPKGIILSGSPASVHDREAPRINEQLLTMGCPVLGICYGMQHMVHLFRGDVEKSADREFGKAQLFIDDHTDLFHGLNGHSEMHVWMSHGDRVKALPADFTIIAHSPNSPVAAIRSTKYPLYGVQFHPEVVHTPQGKQMLENFVYTICTCQPLWDMKSFIESSITQIREEVSQERIICGVSGGVDSTVVAVLLHKAIGKQLSCIFIDNGLLRKGEAQKVVEVFRKHLHIDLIHVDASQHFIDKLSTVTDPERKRKVIGEEFIYVFEKEAEKLGNVTFLAQGTLYPDVIESISLKGPSATIKSHHNVGGLPERMKLRLIEPLRELFKDEVRVVGRELDIPDEMINR